MFAATTNTNCLHSVPAPLPAYLSQGPPVLADPGRVVPLSDSQKFERHYQPNVALAPPKVRDKTIRNSLPHSDHCHDVSHPAKLPHYAVSPKRGACTQYTN